ncbi:MAG: amidohydrolase family protein [Bacteroidia bacterium]|nr:amidohydrolase family protein [Bacteroidia bacterium]MDW8014566.1 amidohydrolase family protein [Bacteroidia bacterium]
MATLPYVGSASVKGPTGVFSPDWLYYEKKLWSQPTLWLREGKVEGLSPERHPDAQRIEGLLSPCWVNCHTHLELSHLQSKVPHSLGMMDFIRRMGRHRGQASAILIRSALSQALEEGTCAFVSHQNVPLPLSALPEGVRVYPLAEFFGRRRQGSHARFRQAKKLGYPLTPHSLYALSPSLLRLARRRSSFPKSLHFFESLEEKLWLEQGRGPFKAFFQSFEHHPRPPRWKWQLGYLHRHSPALWLVHATEAAPKQMEVLLQKFPRLYVVLCPEANYYLFRRTPPLSFWRGYPTRLLLGTDSLANAKSLSLWPVIRRCWMSGFTLSEALQAAVDTPRQWIAAPPLWVRIANLSHQGEITPESRAILFSPTS